MTEHGKYNSIQINCNSILRAKKLGEQLDCRNPMIILNAIIIKGLDIYEKKGITDLLQKEVYRLIEKERRYSITTITEDRERELYEKYMPLIRDATINNNGFVLKELIEFIGYPMEEYSMRIARRIGKELRERGYSPKSKRIGSRTYNVWLKKPDIPSTW